MRWQRINEPKIKTNLGREFTKKLPMTQLKSFNKKAIHLGLDRWFF